MEKRLCTPVVWPLTSESAALTLQSNPIATFSFLHLTGGLLLQDFKTPKPTMQYFKWTTATCLGLLKAVSYLELNIFRVSQTHTLILLSCRRMHKIKIICCGGCLCIAHSRHCHIPCNSIKKRFNFFERGLIFLYLPK